MVAMVAKLANGKWLFYSILCLRNSCFFYAIFIVILCNYLDCKDLVDICQVREEEWNINVDVV